MWEENKEVKGQRQRKPKVDPQLDLESTRTKKIDLTIEEAIDDIKLSLSKSASHFSFVKSRGQRFEP